MTLQVVAGQRPLFRHRSIGLPLLLALACLTLNGCALLSSGNIAAPTQYTLDSSATPAANSGNAGAPRYILDLRPVSAPDWLGSSRMLYRLDYAQNAELSAYTQSRWAAPPANLVGNQLDDTLEASNLFDAVLANSPGNADLTLQVALDDFSQRFASPSASRGRIAATATLLRAATGAVVAQHRFVTTAAAPSDNAVGGVQALTQANRQLDTDILHWLDATLKRCGNTCVSGNS